MDSAWVNEDWKKSYLDASLSLLSRSKSEPFIHRIAMCDEKLDCLVSVNVRHSGWLKMVLKESETDHSHTVAKNTCFIVQHHYDALQLHET